MKSLYKVLRNEGSYIQFSREEEKRQFSLLSLLESLACVSQIPHPASGRRGGLDHESLKTISSAAQYHLRSPVRMTQKRNVEALEILRMLP